MISSFRDLEVYNEAIDLSVEIETDIKKYPKHEQFLLVDQSRRACRGIAPLIAEGYAKRSSLKTFQKFMRDAMGEANEMICHLEVACRLGYTMHSRTENLIQRYDILGRKIHKLHDNWNNSK